KVEIARSPTSGSRQRPGAVERAIRLGYSSVMIDHSHLAFDQNVRDTKEVVQFAHREGAWVQGEIGRLRGTEDWVSVSDAESLLTEPEEALKFHQATGVDTLACSVGTVHGVVKIRGGLRLTWIFPGLRPSTTWFLSP